MGHTLLGTLPKTRRWKEVVELLDDSPQLTGALAAAITEAADRHLQKLKDNESFNYAFWLLVRITAAAKSGDFLDQLQRLGLETSAKTSMLSFISDLSDKVRARTTTDIAAGDFAEIASLAVRSALLDTVALQSQTFWGSTVEDVRASLRTFSSPGGFSEVSQKFFADFLATTLRSALERQLAKHIGPAGSISSIAESIEFSDALGLYARQTARITEEFAKGWYPFHNWRSNHRVTPEEAKGFVAHAIDKLKDSLADGREL